MPLPDERPRQSVANLIGRFEQQTKRQAAAGSPRTSAIGVVSHDTGDSARDDNIKEKREWPPKPNNTSLDDKPPPYMSFWSRASNANITPATTVLPALAGSDLAEKLPAKTDTVTPTQVVATSVPEPVSLPTPQQDHPTDPSPPTVGPNPKPSQRSPVSSVKASATTPRSSLSPRTPASGVKSTSRTASSSLNTPPQALRPQFTGQSTTSTSPRQTRTPSRTAATTPSVSKTPSSASRPKTPAANANTTPSLRPKTPSSGLFAPTAASLARARNALPQPPLPTRKITLSSAAAERLSKPTAASMSKVRQPVAASGSSATSPPKKAARPSTSKANATAKTAPPSAPKTTEAEEMISTDTLPEIIHQENGHHIIEAPSEDPTKEIEAVVQSNGDGRLGEEDGRVDKVITPDDPLPDNSTVPDGKPKADTTEVHVEPELLATDGGPDSRSANADISREEPSDPLPEPQLDPQSETNSLPPHQSDTPQESLDNTNKPELTSTSYVGDDIVDIVNLLESAPRSRKLSITSIPDEVHEIPDEE